MWSSGSMAASTTGTSLCRDACRPRPISSNSPPRRLKALRPVRPTDLNNAQELTKATCKATDSSDNAEAADDSSNRASSDQSASDDFPAAPATPPIPRRRSLTITGSNCICAARNRQAGSRSCRIRRKITRSRRARSAPPAAERRPARRRRAQTTPPIAANIAERRAADGQ